MPSIQGKAREELRFIDIDRKKPAISTAQKAARYETGASDWRNSIYVRQGQNRDRWLVTNVSGKTITISDLLAVPAIDNNQTVDLLFYESKEKVSTSNVLPLLIKRGWLVMKKILYTGQSTNVTSQTVDNAIDPIQIDQVESLIAGSGGGGGGVPSSGCITICPPSNPKFSYGTIASVASMSQSSISSTAVSNGYLGKLTGLTVTGNTMFKAYAVMVNNDVESQPFAIWFAANMAWQFTPPTPEYFTVEGGSGGFNGFRVYIKNLDPSDTSDFYAIFYYDEE
ncbi:unnamed protein product [Sphagnum jensenii]|uniref:Uncharacterized protein n=1 Tax=Sphagnum jensenii TaxID=128206 RepID=A0ABP0VA19_9BRYO